MRTGTPAASRSSTANTGSGSPASSNSAPNPSRCSCSDASENSSRSSAFVASVMVVEPAHAVGFEEVALGVVDHRPAVELVVGDGIHEQLQFRLRQVLLLGNERDNGREIAARAVAADRDTRAVAADVGRVL